MSRKRRFEIIIETTRKLEIRAGEGLTTMVCPECGERVWMLSPAMAGALVQGDTRSIYRQVERGKLHAGESATGGLLVCLPSLLHQLGRSNPDLEVPRIPDGTDSSEEGT